MHARPWIRVARACCAVHPLLSRAAAPCESARRNPARRWPAHGDVAGWGFTWPVWRAAASGQPWHVCIGCAARAAHHGYHRGRELLAPTQPQWQLLGAPLQWLQADHCRRAACARGRRGVRAASHGRHKKPLRGAGASAPDLAAVAGPPGPYLRLLLQARDRAEGHPQRQPRNVRAGVGQREPAREHGHRRGAQRRCDARHARRRATACASSQLGQRSLSDLSAAAT